MRSFGEGNGTPLQYSCLENPMDGGAWKAAVHGVAEGRTRLSDFTFTFPFHALEKEMATHSSVLAWRIPGMGKPGGLPSMGSQSRTQLKWLSNSNEVLGVGRCYFKNTRKVMKYKEQLGISGNLEYNQEPCFLTPKYQISMSTLFLSTFIHLLKEEKPHGP